VVSALVLAGRASPTQYLGDGLAGAGEHLMVTHTTAVILRLMDIHITARVTCRTAAYIRTVILAGGSQVKNSQTGKEVGDVPLWLRLSLLLSTNNMAMVA
jgi:hypothetical protein